MSIWSHVVFRICWDISKFTATLSLVSFSYCCDANLRVWCEGIDLVLMPNLQSKSLLGCQSLPLAYDTNHMESANFFVVFNSVSTYEATYKEFLFLFQWRHQQKVTWCLLNLEFLISLCSLLKSLDFLSCFHTLNWSLILTNMSLSLYTCWALEMYTDSIIR